jgi:heme oxygenase
MTILREVTREKHSEVENLPLIQKLLHGELTEQQYVSYLYELYFVYGAIERFAEFAGVLDGLTDICRFHRIKKDLEELHFGYRHELCNSTIDYIRHLAELCANKPDSILAHVYVRHMGDLYGGKIIARIVPGSGNCYMFEDRPKLIKEFNAKLYEDLGEEANIAFQHFSNIFTELGIKILSK